MNWNRGRPARAPLCPEVLNCDLPKNQGAWCPLRTHFYSVFTVPFKWFTEVARTVHSQLGAFSVAEYWINLAVQFSKVLNGVKVKTGCRLKYRLPDFLGGFACVLTVVSEPLILLLWGYFRMSEGNWRDRNPLLEEDYAPPWRDKGKKRPVSLANESWSSSLKDKKRSEGEKFWESGCSLEWCSYGKGGESGEFKTLDDSVRASPVTNSKFLKSDVKDYCEFSNSQGNQEASYEMSSLCPPFPWLFPFGPMWGQASWSPAWGRPLSPVVSVSVVVDSCSSRLGKHTSLSNIAIRFQLGSLLIPIDDPKDISCDGQSVSAVDTMAIDLSGMNYDNPFVLTVEGILMQINGNWNCNNRTMIRAAEIKSWNFVNFSPRFSPSKAKYITHELQQCCNKRGMVMSACGGFLEEPPHGRNLNPIDHLSTAEDIDLEFLITLPLDRGKDAECLASVDACKQLRDMDLLGSLKNNFSNNGWGDNPKNMLVMSIPSRDICCGANARSLPVTLWSSGPDHAKVFVPKLTIPLCHKGDVCVAVNKGRNKIEAEHARYFDAFEKLYQEGLFNKQDAQNRTNLFETFTKALQIQQQNEQLATIDLHNEEHMMMEDALLHFHLDMQTSSASLYLRRAEFVFILEEHVDVCISDSGTFSTDCWASGDHSSSGDHSTFNVHLPNDYSTFGDCSFSGVCSTSGDRLTSNGHFTLLNLQQKQTLNHLPSISFEEREAAYLAARERIFSLSASQESDEPKEQVAPRPRTVPVVARRMIAHALGKRIMVDSLSQKPEVTKCTEFPCADEKLTDKCLNDALHFSSVPLPAAKACSGDTPNAVAKTTINKSSNTDSPCIDDRIRDKKLNTKLVCTDEKMTYKNLDDASEDAIGAPQDSKASLRHSSAAAAKRMIDKNLNAEIPCLDEKMTGKNLNTKIPCTDEKMTEKHSSDASSQVASVVPQAGKASLGCTPAAAAKRMFAQALGIPLANGSFRGSVELPARHEYGTNCASNPESFHVSTSSIEKPFQGTDSVDVVQERSSSLESNLRPLELHDSRAQMDQPSVSNEQQMHPQNHSSMPRMSNAHIPGKAAQRLFAQALGIHTLSSTSMEGNRTSGVFSISPTGRGLRRGHKARVPGFEDSNIVHNALVSSSGITSPVNGECLDYDTESNNLFSRAGDASGNSHSDVAVHMDSDPSRSIEMERHVSGISPKQMGGERNSLRSISKGRNNFQVNTKRTVPKASSKSRHVNNSGPAKREDSNCRLTRTCPADETSMVFCRCPAD
eukprot:Gb_15626 [translate_table: standard]